ncbi:MAG: protein of unknown function DUF2394 [Bacteroidetes bacterium]|nr:MAG: protein of unknown function DUF2394 [Bacteroidota bacterium]
MKHLTILTILTLLLFFSSLSAHSQNNTTYLFIGTYTEGQADKGIYVYAFDSKTGQLKKVSTAEQVTNPSFITVSPDGRFIYACTDTKMPGAGSVTAFAFDSISGKLTTINKQNAGGENPVYVAVHKSGKFVVNGNYTAGNVSVFSTNAGGSLNPHTQLIQFTDSSVNKQRQEKAHIHAAVFSPQHDFMFFPDLGSDKIRTFRFDADRENPLVPADSLSVNTKPGSGPRHFTFHPHKNFAYCIEELSGTISCYAYRNGKLDSIQRILSYAKPQEINSGADIHISPDGLFLYASNRQENTISIFSIDPENGRLKLQGHQSTFGDHPRNFVIDPTGKFLLVANLATHTVVVFERDMKTGLLKKTGIQIDVPRPSCLQMRRYGK